MTATFAEIGHLRYDAATGFGSCNRILYINVYGITTTRNAKVTADIHDGMLNYVRPNTVDGSRTPPYRSEHVPPRATDRYRQRQGIARTGSLIWLPPIHADIAGGQFSSGLSSTTTH